MEWRAVVTAGAEGALRNITPLPRSTIRFDYDSRSTAPRLIIGSPLDVGAMTGAVWAQLCEALEAQPPEPLRMTSSTTTNPANAAR